eukprot:CAMPEP_0176129802 /NCGR_PEP_ID=MMETSP0120_2-20121206/65650_1 /TAXON_ID=160619 /ORGANISM="Kryptoperidinium foliaceum, Strain CCMP 1326" /LENGTH=53 /DNA_ID=CAMNT_0017465033 /DNA_START=34 /DNA_END=191 /DNA_ORIENTATION=+
MPDHALLAGCDARLLSLRRAASARSRGGHRSQCPRRRHSERLQDVPLQGVQRS